MAANKLKIVVFLCMALLIIPAAVQGAASSDVGGESGWVVHVVQPGDTLGMISNRYQVSADRLRLQNNLPSDVLEMGQKLLIKPAETSTSYFIYSVQPGDTPWILSRRFNTSLDKLLQINGWDSSVVLYVGNRIRIPVSVDSAPCRIYTVKSGDTPWLISQHFGVSLEKLMKINDLTGSSILYAGQKLVIPLNEEPGYWIYTIRQGDTPWILSQRYQVPLEQILALNKFSYSSVLYVGQQIKMPLVAGRLPDLKPWVTYTNHTVKKGETPWTISINYGIPMPELLKVNGLSDSDYLYPGQVITVPVHHVPVHPTLTPQHGELLDWWTEAQYVWPIGTEATVIDFSTRKSWRVIRSYGAAHADVEPLAAEDTFTMLQVWGGQWSWAVRPVLVVVNGHRIAASASAMPHSIEKIGKENNFDGHFDVHFLNSRRHEDFTVSEAHQQAVYIAAGTGPQPN